MESIDQFISDENNSFDIKKSVSEQIHIYDIMGNRLYQGVFSNLNIDEIDHKGVLIIAYFDEQGSFLRSEKKVILRNF